MGIFEAIVLGIVEGLSEFLPVSSTGHLILASALLKLQQSEAHKVFEVVIQLGAMLAVVEVYRKQLFARPDLVKKVCFAFLPTGTIGFLLYKLVKSFFQPSLVSYMLIVGGVAFIVIEFWMKDRPATTHTLDEISYRQAFSIGLVQCLSMVPGVSRSGATIMGGLLFGLDRKDAAEFSFLLALPTMFAATCYDIYKNYTVFHAADWQNIAVGFVTSFIFGVIGIKALLKFVTSHTFIPFGIYRIVVGVLFLVFLF
ncbi:undecaprenyl-diphosphate phosphatase [Geomonas subterranea]|uniref:Undecaprenyl-diphosphatase n=1 Tax=Geomonas subterranea TaxID=2847989 RepID=A0ABX8LPS8_9BACT|nr:MULTISPECIES: undecaprenyl-diphosphate phosphatase [Geomonas]QXE92319.1 undecaprenyl-diphosphate phosphatase [Geomonas subterranea]QXM09582.1 undecaprenyl-diphosphate phosphatase [Geomonas subterranea]